MNILKLIRLHADGTSDYFVDDRGTVTSAGSFDFSSSFLKYSHSLKDICTVMCMDKHFAYFIKQVHESEAEWHDYNKITITLMLYR